MAAKECPNCRLLSPGSASVCACGWDFEAGAMRAPRPMTARPPRERPASAPAASVTPAMLAAPGTAEPAPFWQRVFLMPFVPSLWGRATGWRPLQVALPVAVFCLLVSATLVVYRGFGMRSDLRRMADAYDGSYPAVVVAGGKVRVEGEGVIHWTDRNNTFLVDPRESVPLDRITTPEYIVVRETQVIRKQGFRTQVTQVADLQGLFGDPLRFDSASLRAFERKWGLVILLGMGALMLVVMMIGDLLCLAYVAAAAGLALVLRGRAAGLGYGACFRAALAPYGIAGVLSVTASFAGHSVGFCVGVWLWPLLLTGLATVAVGRRPAPWTAAFD